MLLFRQTTNRLVKVDRLIKYGDRGENVSLL
nr:MAG TPA: hypothetical protein [Caudoviricetes sp.]